MKTPQMHRVRHSDLVPIAIAILMTGLGVFLIAGAGIPTIGFAQSNPAPQTDARGNSMAPPDAQLVFPQGLMQAPVGHRQPRLRDLPPNVLHKEGGGGALNSDRELDRKLEICKGC
jgi:hypothetical protein